MIVIEIAYLWGREGEMVIKELALMAHGSKYENGCNSSTATYMFKPPYPESEISAHTKLTNQWLTEKVHNISWDAGKYEYAALSERIAFEIQYFETSQIYTRGYKQSILLTQLITKPMIVHNLEIFDCPRSEQLSAYRRLPFTTCNFPHKTDQQCALYSCHKYVLWLHKSGRGCNKKHCFLLF